MLALAEVWGGMRQCPARMVSCDLPSAARLERKRGRALDMRLGANMLRFSHQRQ